MFHKLTGFCTFSSSYFHLYALVFSRRKIKGIINLFFCRPAVFHILISVFVCFGTELEEEANRPEKDTKTLSADLIEYVQYMVREHKDNYKVRASAEA